MGSPAAILSSKALLDALGPRWRIDVPAIGSHAVYDCYRHDHSREISVELRGPDASVAAAIEVRVAPEPDQPAFVTGGGLGVSGGDLGDPELERQTCEAMAAALQQRFADAPPRWQLPPDREDVRPDELESEIETRPASLAGDPDGALLDRDARRYHRLYGVPPEGRRVHIAGEAIPGISVYYPPPRNGSAPPSGSLRDMPSRIARRRTFRRYFAALGCVFDREDVARTVPTPTCFDTTVRAALGTDPPLRPRLFEGRFMSIRPRAWATLVSSGTLPVPVAARGWVELYRAARRARALASIPVDVGMLAHDMGLHAMAFHAIPGAAWQELAAIARRGVRGLGSGRRVASFFEGPLTTTAWDLWSGLEDPSGFADAFAGVFGDLCRELERA